MPRINLLPWRDARRQQRERQFFFQLGIALLVGIGVVCLWSIWMTMRVTNAMTRDAYLSTQIKQLDVQLGEIRELDKVRARLLARKQIIERLQVNRSQMVHLFDELVKTIPANARLTELKQTGQSMTLRGVADSNASIAGYMRNIEDSPWMGKVDLSQTENIHGLTHMPYSFGLTVKLRLPTEHGIASKKLYGHMAEGVPQSVSDATRLRAETGGH